MDQFEIRPHDYSFVLLTTMKDEAPYILDWISYHLSIGFTHFVVLTNDCSDGTDKILRHLEKMGIVTHKNNPAPHPRGPQKNGYLKMRALEPVQKAGWLMALDVDEYVRIDVGAGHLSDLLEAIGPNISAVSLVWQLFGNNNVEHIVDEPIISQFTKAAHPLQARPYECLAFKTLYKNGFFAKIGTHRPNDFEGTKLDEFEWIDGDGCSVKWFHNVRHWCSHANGLAFGTALGRINHYALRSKDAFANKWDRGFVHPNAPTVRGKGTFGDYWKLFNWNSVEETQILSRLNDAYEIKSMIMDKKRIAQFHQDGYNYHRMTAQNVRNNHLDFFNTINDLGYSYLTDNLPDFSINGCPPVGDIHYVNTLILNQKLQNSLLNDSILKQFNYQEPIQK